MVNVGAIEATLGLNNQNFIKGFARADKAVSGFSNRMQSSGQAMQSIGSSMTRNITLPAIAAGGAGLLMANHMNEGMANIATLIPGNSKRVQELKSNIQDLAVEAGKSTSDLSGGMYQVISAFGDTSESMKILKINAKAASAGLATTTDAINLTSAVTKGYGDTSAKAIGHVSDLALLTVRLGQTTFPDLAASIGRVTPLTASLGASQEELFAVMATATGVTGGAAEVSTQLRGALQGLMAPTADMTKLYKSLGISSGEGMIKQFGLVGSIQKITEAANKSGKPLQNYLGSIEGQTLALALSGKLSGDYKKKLEAMSKAAGTTNIAFLEQTQGINAAGFALSKLRSKVEVTGQRFGDALAPALIRVVDNSKPLLDKIIGLVDGFSRLDPAMQNNIMTAVGFTMAAGPVLSVVGKITSGISGMSSVLRVLSPILITTTKSAEGLKLALAANPIGIAAIALAVAVPLAWKFGEGLGKAITPAYDLKTANDRLYTSINMLKRSTTEYNDAVAASASAQVAEIQSKREIERLTGITNRLTKEGKTGTDDYKEAMALLTIEQFKHKDATDKLALARAKEKAESEKQKQATINMKTAAFQSWAQMQNIPDKFTKPMSAKVLQYLNISGPAKATAQTNLVSYVSGMLSQQGYTSDSAKALATAAVTQLDKTSLAGGKGKDMATHFSNGIVNQISADKKSGRISQQASATLDQLKSKMHDKKAADGGRSIGNSWVNALSSVLKASARMSGPIGMAVGAVSDLLGHSLPTKGPLTRPDKGGLSVGEVWMQGLVKGLDRTSAVYTALKEKADMITKAFSDIGQRATQAIKESFDSIRSSIAGWKGAFDLFSTEDMQKLSGKALIDNMKAQAAHLEKYKSVLNNLKKKVSAELFAELSLMGPDQLFNLQSVAGMSKKELKQFEGANRKKQSAITGAAKVANTTEKVGIKITGNTFNINVPSGKVKDFITELTRLSRQAATAKGY